MFLSKNARLTSFITTKQAKELIMQPTTVLQGCSDNHYIPTSHPAKSDSQVDIKSPVWQKAVSARVREAAGAGRHSLNFV